MLAKRSALFDGDIGVVAERLGATKGVELEVGRAGSGGRGERGMLWARLWEEGGCAIVSAEPGAGSVCGVLLVDCFACCSGEVERGERGGLRLASRPNEVPEVGSAMLVLDAVDSFLKLEQCV